MVIFGMPGLECLKKLLLLRIVEKITILTEGGNQYTHGACCGVLSSICIHVFAVKDKIFQGQLVYMWKENFLINSLASLSSLAIAFSGGVDSSLLAVLANKHVKGKVLLVNAHTPFFTEKETWFVNRWTRKHGYTLKIIKIDVLKTPKIKKNLSDRCYHCKKALMKEIIAVAKFHGIDIVADGSNIDDLSDYRPGHKAAAELGIIHPFIEAKITKNEIRKLAKKYNLENWNTPVQACLATRIPANTPILNEYLRKIEKAEDYLYNLGFLGCRVRMLENTAKIELQQDQIANSLLHRESIVNKLKEMGFRNVLLDLEGYKKPTDN